VPLRLAVALILISSTVSAQQPPSPETPPLRRWFEFDQAAIGTRYRVIENSAGTVTNNHLQHRQQFRAHFNADPKGRYALHAGVFTGGSFTSSWNNTGLGTGDPVANMRLKQLFAAAAPVTGVQGQVGSFYVNRGEHTEITNNDDDA
jgi:hypothetical protein